MSEPFDTETLNVQGIEVQVEYFYDSDMDPPWENDDGRGKVRKTVKRHRDGESDKRPGERPLNQPSRHEYQFYYDWQEATQRARKDGWNTEPYDAPNRVQRAVQSDFDFIRLFLADDWEYVGVVVKILDDAGDTLVEDSCRGFETYKGYHKESAKEMAEALVKGYLKQQEEELAAQIKEATEVQYWAERDVVTV